MPFRISQRTSQGGRQAIKSECCPKDSAKDRGSCYAISTNHATGLHVRNPHIASFYFAGLSDQTFGNFAQLLQQLVAWVHVRLLKFRGHFSLRWCRSRNAVSSVLLGQSSVKQLEETIEIFNANPAVEFKDDDEIKYFLPQSLLWEIDRVHMRNRLPIFASTRTQSNWDGRGEIGETIP